MKVLDCGTRLRGHGNKCFLLVLLVGAALSGAVDDLCKFSDVLLNAFDARDDEQVDLHDRHLRVLRELARCHGFGVTICFRGGPAWSVVPGRPEVRLRYTRLSGDSLGNCTLGHFELLVEPVRIPEARAILSRVPRGCRETTGPKIQLPESPVGVFAMAVMEAEAASEVARIGDTLRAVQATVDLLLREGHECPAALADAERLEAELDQATATHADLRRAREEAELQTLTDHLEAVMLQMQEEDTPGLQAQAKYVRQEILGRLGP